MVPSDSGYPRMAASVFSALLLSPDGTRTEVRGPPGSTERFFAFLHAEVPQLMRKWKNLNATGQG